jgi:WD40 repeat protein
VWNLNTGQEIAQLTNFLFWVGSVAFSPDGKILATASADQTVKLWDTNQWQEITTLRGHEFEVWWVAFSPDGRKLVTASKDDTIKVWDTSARPERKLEKMPFAGTRDFAFSPDGKTLLLLHTNDSFSLIDTATWVETERRSLPLGSNWVGAAISNQRNLVLSAEGGGLIRVLGLAGLSELSNFSIGAPPARWLLLSPDAKTIAVLNGRGDIELWDTASAPLVRELEVGDGPTCWDFSPDSGKLAIGYYDATVEIWDLPSKSRRTLPTGHEERIMGVAFSNDGRTLATTSFDVHLIKLWEVETWRELATLGGQLAEFACIAFSPDGHRLAAGGNDGSVTLWDLTNRKPQEVAKLKGTMGRRVQRLFFLPDGNTLVSLADDRVVRVWRAPSWREIDAAEKADAKSQPP